jgi:uncharacterized membrane protein SpoIIM required for sporulation
VERKAVHLSLPVRRTAGAPSRPNGIIILVAVLVISGGPHGMFELPAIFIVWGSCRACGCFRKKRKRRTRNGRKAYRVYFTLVLPLLVIAAVIKGMGIVLYR